MNQHRYLLGGSVTPKEDNTIWWLPLRLQTSVSPVTTDILNTRETRIPLATSNIYEAQDFYYKFNTHQTAFYRTCYPPAAISRFGQIIAKQLTSGKEIFPPSDRVGILSDCFALAVSGLVKTTDVLNLINSFKKESEYW